MRELKSKFLIVFVAVSFLAAANLTYASPYFKLDSKDQWNYAKAEGKVYPMDPCDWEYYIEQWQNYTVEGTPYPNDPFIPAESPTGDLYVYDGNKNGGGLDPCDAGLVMAWGSNTMPDGNYSSAWIWDYQLDPDLTNVTINLSVTAPNQDANGVWMNRISFGLQDVNGFIRSWDWNCPNPIPWNVPTRISIDTSKTGRSAVTPTASAYANNPGFWLKNVQNLIVDENGSWVGGATPAPPPGSGLTGLWNYWHWVLVTPNTTVDKGIYVKWSQPPVVIDTNNPPIINGWDELSDYNNSPIMADDWNCVDERPLTDVHWWGSFIGWDQPNLPPVVPKAFHLGVWTDSPDPNPADPCTFSHPNMMIWENYCDNYVWNFAGLDKDPCMKGDPLFDDPNMDTCFQFTQLLSQDEWFYQEPNDPWDGDPNKTTYWLSIAAIYDPCDIVQYPWGWKTRPHFYKDDAFRITAVNPPIPPIVGSTVAGGVPIKLPAWPDPTGITWDLAFELTTNEPNYMDNPIPGDLNGDKIVNLVDLSILAGNWLVSVP